MADLSTLLFAPAPASAPTRRRGEERIDTDALITKIRDEAVRQGLPDPDLAVAVAIKESSLKPYAWGDRGASLGLFQLQRAAAIDAGIDPDKRQDVDLNIQGGVRYLKQKLAQSKGNVAEALRRYNSGTPDFRGLGDPKYVDRALAIRQEITDPTRLAYYGARSAAPASPSLGTMAGRAATRAGQAVRGALTPASAEARPPGTAGGAAVSPARQTAGRDLSQELFGAPSGAPASGRGQQLSDDLFGSAPPVSPSPPSAPPVAPAPAAAPGPPAAGTSAPAAPAPEDYRSIAAREMARYNQEEQQRLTNWKVPVSTGISAGSAMLGTAAGTFVAPLTGPFAPAMPLVGEMAGSSLGRQLNVALGLEDPGTLGDVASVALPGLGGLKRTVQGFRAPPAAPIVPPQAADLVEQSQRTGVPLTYGESTGHPLVKKGEQYLEQVPGVGIGGFRERQHAAARETADTVVKAQQQAMRDAPWATMTQLKAAAATGSKQAQRLLDEINQAGDDMGRVVQASGNLQAWRVRQTANRLYNRVGELAEGLGNVPMTKTLATIDDTLKELRTAVVPDTETIRYLEQLKSGLQGQTSTTISPLLDASGNPVTRTVTTPGKTTYGQLRQLRSDLGDTISDYYQGSNAVVGAKGVGNLTKVKAALEQDLDTFALQSPNPELRKAATRADTHYKNSVVPFEDRQLAQALTSNTPDEIYGKFIQRGHGDRAKNFYNALDPKGKAAVQYGMVAEAQHKALDPTTGNFSPAKFEGSLKAIQEARGVFFTGREAWKLDGLMKVMRAAERAGQFKENPPTGQRAVPWLMAGGLGALASTNPVLAGTAVAATKALSWALTSPTGTKLLLRAHGVGENTLALDNVLRELTTQGARIMATEAGQGLQQGQQVQVEPGRLER